MVESGLLGKSSLGRGSVANKVTKVRIYRVSGKGRGAALLGVGSVSEVVENDGSSQARWCSTLSDYLESFNSCIGNGEPWKVLEQRNYMMNSRMM